MRNEANNESQTHCIVMNCDGVGMKNRQVTINTNQMDGALRIRSVDIQNMVSTRHIQTQQEKI
jgi:hypothetical protein